MSRNNRCSKHSCPVCYKPRLNKPLDSTDNVLRCLKMIKNQNQEYFVCLSLDSSYKLIRQRVVCIGTLDSVIAHPREVFSGPLKDSAKYIIIAHNHPSGETRPSKQDISTTQQLIAAGRILGIPIHDHFIVSGNAYFSFKRQRLI